MPTFSRGLLLLVFLGVAALGLPAVAAKKPPPATLDCAALPCAEVMPAAASFRPAAGNPAADAAQAGAPGVEAPTDARPYWEGLDADGDVIGWVGLSTDFVDIKAYSGKPLVTLVGLDPDGLITGARVVHHSEPILLVGIPEQALHDFAAFYTGQSALVRIVVGRASRPEMISVDAISGATVTVLAQNQTILDTARGLGTQVGIFEAGHTVRGHFVAEPTPWSFQQMLDEGALGRLVVSPAEMGLDESTEPALDLYFGIADAPQIGRALLGDRGYEHHMKRLAPGEHLVAMLNRGSFSFKGSAFVRGGIFDRVRLQQGLREITFRDTDYKNLPDSLADGAPEFNEGAIFVARGGRLDPSEPYELIFLASRYDGRSAYSREFREFTASHELSDAIYQVDKDQGGLPWRQAWRNRSTDVVVLGVFLLFVVGVFAARRYTTADPVRIKRLHLATMVISFVLVGVYMRAQPSVTQILTAVGSAVHEWRWELFLSEPLIFMLWIFIFGVSVIWGRGVFCGWVCPYGAMTELAYKLTHWLGWKGFELPDRIHNPLRNLRYVILGVLVAVFLWDSILAEQMAEIEPFKSTFLVPAWTRHWGFLAWWVVLLAISFVSYRPFCRYVCPLGGGLSLLSSFRPSGPQRRVFCTQCTICTRGCESRAIRPNGSIDPRECLSCMDCEATYRNPKVCPPLIGITRLEARSELTPRQRDKLEGLRLDEADV